MRSDLVCLNLFLRLGKTKSYDQKREREMVLGMNADDDMNVCQIGAADER